MADEPLTIYCDIETTGLNPYRDKLVAVGFAVDDCPPRALLHDRDRKVIQAVLDLDDAVFVAHNAPFDFGFLEVVGYRIPDPTRWLDSLLLAQVVRRRTPPRKGKRPEGFKLPELAQQLIAAGELPADILDPEAQLKRWLKAARQTAKKEDRRLPEKGDAPAELLLPYLHADVEQARAVAKHYRANVNGQEAVLDLERRCQPAIYAAERRGAPVDSADAFAVRAASAVTLQELRAHAFELAGKPFPLKSAQQIEQALRARGVDLSHAKRTPTDLLARSADALTLIDDELPRTLVTHATESTFHGLLDGLVKHIVDGRIHTSYRQMGAVTGRMSSSEPNMQNVPAHDLRARYIIRASPGKLLVGADLDNVELRVAACYAPDGELARALAGGDLHQRTADALKIDRTLAKRINFGILYGSGVPRVARVLGISRDEAKGVLDGWYALYPEIDLLKRRLGRRIHQRGYIRTAGGRRHYFDDRSHKAINYLVQGTAAEVLKAAIVELHAQGLPMILFVHDEIVAEVPEERATWAAELLEDVLARDYGNVITGLTATATIAERWSDFKEPGYRPELVAGEDEEP